MRILKFIGHNLKALSPAQWSLIGLVLIAAAAFFGFSESEFLQIDVSRSELGISSTFLLGTDLLGRSILLKTLMGLGAAMGFGFISALISTTFGSAMGVFGGYFGKKIDLIVVGFYSVLDSVPYILLISCSALVFGEGLFSLALIIGLTSWMKTCRLIRAETLSLRQQDFLAASASLGSDDLRQIFIHILPNLMHLIRARFGIIFVLAIKLEIVLTYLGIGAQAGTISWGTVVFDGQEEIVKGGWTSLAAISFMLFGLSLSVQRSTAVITKRGGPGRR